MTKISAKLFEFGSSCCPNGTTIGIATIAMHDMIVVKMINGLLLPIGVLILSERLPNRGTNRIAATGLKIQAYEATQLETPNSPALEIIF